MRSLKNIQIRIAANAGLWEGLARLEFVGSDVPVVVHATVNVRAIREALVRKHMPEDGAVSGGFFSFIKNAVRKIARAKIFQKIGDAVKSVVNSPYLGAAIGVASTVFPAIGATYVAAKAAVAVVDAVSKGDAKVIANVQTLAESTIAKNPLAAQALDTIKAAQNSPLAAFIPAVTG